MIAKVEVRKRLGAYEERIRGQIYRIEDAIDGINVACESAEMLGEWRQSNTYAILAAKRKLLYEVLADIREIRFDDMFADEN